MPLAKPSQARNIGPFLLERKLGAEGRTIVRIHGAGELDETIVLAPPAGRFL